MRVVGILVTLGLIGCSGDEIVAQEPTESAILSGDYQIACGTVYVNSGSDLNKLKPSEHATVFEFTIDESVSRQDIAAGSVKRNVTNLDVSGHAVLAEAVRLKDGEVIFYQNPQGHAWLTAEFESADGGSVHLDLSTSPKRASGTFEMAKVGAGGGFPELSLGGTCNSTEAFVPNGSLD